MGVDNYARFYALLGKLPGADKETLVLQFTNGRTPHLHLMTAAEYGSMCTEMDRVAGYDARREAWRREMRRKRSAVLHQMQLLGVDTADWSKVDKFCQDKRIAGMAFREIDGDGLDALLTKLHAIRRKIAHIKKRKMTNREIVSRIMSHIREVTKDLSEEQYAEVLESLWLEIEDERSQCNWNETEC